MEDTGGWCTIESDPGVFTELVKMIGVEGVQVDELYSLDPYEFQRIAPVYGLVFLFKWTPSISRQSSKRNILQYNTVPDLFFANQVINNACATQALLSILLNATEPDDSSSVKLKIGDELTNFKMFTKDFDPQLKGLAISNCILVRSAHNSFAPVQVLESVQDGNTAQNDAEDELYHFVSYVPLNGSVYELDGLQKGPILLGKIEEGSSWVDVAGPAIQSRIDEYSASEIRFNLMAVVRDRSMVLENEKKVLEEKLRVDDSVKERLMEIERELEEEKRRKENSRRENARRRHNYVPFMLEMLKILASKGELQKMIDEAKQKQSQS
uniref:Ubiquitin carboxyl-terminal hydrolase n=1 Tax=Timspurckia oligopyrenoides TaxID=708627 RepID=A0A7S1ESE7_9RHOD|mmetsp:Transcript_3996/g.7009  ORF Transcript_3996/g.7009 Transcript_3996/m.7009 type:complete len:325 (+) Transcript_3996:109-1083(+)|eukprot:CAMPEP_0182447970 /NCGR_PEP_ID=MMETSP1172-20130603/22282_1 /TAXON_ID=708627 /ORGANISM="Timspurckia oligopyrenoides, Strain CCMP3278" /LENGTH=324 /DNA_ID=CAMNT_0024644643 /DNA_START=74 /DNA_END=1048 /DNA_ORIENTATION=+